jgi:hypothetical protein
LVRLYRDEIIYECLEGQNEEFAADFKISNPVIGGLVNTVRNLRVPSNIGNFLSEELPSFQEVARMS